MAIQLGDTAGNNRTRPDLAPASAVRANAAARRARSVPYQFGKTLLAPPNHRPLETALDTNENVLSQREFHVEVVHRHRREADQPSPVLVASGPPTIAPPRWSRLLPYALLSSLLAPPLGAVLAIISLVHTADGRIRGRGQAISTLALAVTMSLFGPLLGLMAYNNHLDQRSTEAVSADLLSARRSVLTYQNEHGRLPSDLSTAGFTATDGVVISYGLTAEGDPCLTGRGPRNRVLLFVGAAGLVSADGC